MCIGKGLEIPFRRAPQCVPFLFLDLKYPSTARVQCTADRLYASTDLCRRVASAMHWLP